MKKFCAGILVGLLLVTAAGCSVKTSNSPEEVAIAYMHGLMEANLDIMDKYAIVEQEKITKAKVYELMRRNSMTEAEVYEDLLLKYGIVDEEEMPETYEEYMKISMKLWKKYWEETWGENYSVNNGVILSSTDMENEDKEKILEDLSDDYFEPFDIAMSDIVDVSEIEEMKEIKGKLYITGTEETTSTFTTYVVKVNKQWKALNFFDVDGL